MTVTGCTGDERVIPNVPKEDREKLYLGVDKEKPNWNIVGDNRIRKVFKIPVGNIPADEVEDYIRKVSEKFKKATQIQPELINCDIFPKNDEDICYFLPTNNNKMHANYIHVIPNSHFWTDLAQIRYSIDHELERQKRELEIKDNNTIYVGEPLDREYILIGLNNSIKNSYELKQDKKVKMNSSHYAVFESIESMIEYVQSKIFNLEDLRDMISNTINVGINLTNGLKMERKEVYKRLDGERDYQDKTWVARRTANGTPDKEKSIAEWLTYMEHHLNKVKEAIYYLKDDEALAGIRKVTALGVRAMEIHGCPERIMPERIGGIDVKKSSCSCDDYKDEK